MNHESDNNQTLISELSERVVNGLIKENPTFVLLLGMCPTLAVTTSAKNGLGMGVTTMVVLALSNLFISLLRKIIPNKIRIPAFIVIIASFVTIVELLLEAYIPSLYKALGLYIPLIVVNCIILGRAEAYAYSHKPLPSLFDGIGMGMGFTIALTLIGAFRELLGAGTVFSFNVMPKGYTPVSIFIMAPGAFFVLAMLTAIQNKIKEIGEKKGKDMSKIQSGCGGNCLECNKECKVDINSASSETDDEKTEAEVINSDISKPVSNEENKETLKPLAEAEKKEVSAPFKEVEKKEASAPFKEAEKKEVSEPFSEVEKKEASALLSEAGKEDTLKPVTEAKKDDNSNSVNETEKTISETSEKANLKAKVSDDVEPLDEYKEQLAVAKAARADKKYNKPEFAKNLFKKKESASLETTDENDTADILSDSDLEILDISDLKKAMSSGSVNRKPKRSLASLEKAQAMMEKVKEGNDD